MRGQGEAEVEGATPPPHPQTHPPTNPPTYPISPQAVNANPNITMLTGCTAVDLALTKSGTCVGAHVLHEETGEVVTLLGGSTILATGGCGEVYEHTSNPREVRPYLIPGRSLFTL